MGQLKIIETFKSNELKSDGQDSDRKVKENTENDAEVPQKAARDILGVQIQRQKLTSHSSFRALVNSTALFSQFESSNYERDEGDEVSISIDTTS